MGICWTYKNLVYICREFKIKDMLELRMLKVDIKEELQDVQKWIDSADYKSPYLEGVKMGLKLALQNIEIALVSSKRSELVNEILEE